MRQAELEDRSITELRAIAQAMGAKFSFGDDKQKMISIIRAYLASKVRKPPIPDPIEPSDKRLIIDRPRNICTQLEILEALKKYTERGLLIRFPTEDQWMLSFGKREDSGSMCIPLRDVVRCAEALSK